MRHLSKHILFIFAFTLILYFGKIEILNAQRTYIDSLEIRLSTSTQDKEKADLLNEIAFNLKQTNISKAIDYTNQSLLISQNIDYKAGQIQSNILLGIIYKNSGSFDKAIKYNLSALKIAEGINAKDKISICYNNIGSIYQSQSNFNQAIDYYKRSLIIEEELGNKSQISIRLYNIGTIYELTDSLDLAHTYYYNSLLIEQQLNNPEGIYFALYGIAGVDLLRGKTDVALENIEKALEICQNINDLAGLARCNIEKAKILKAQKKYDLAILSLNRSILLADSINYLSELNDAYLEMSNIYADLQDFKKAYSYLNYHLQINDSINNIEINSRVAEIAAKYELEKKEKEIEFFKKESELQSTKNKMERKSRYYLLISFILALALAISNIQRILKRVRQIIYYISVLTISILTFTLIIFLFGSYNEGDGLKMFIFVLVDVVTYSVLPIFIILYVIERVLLKRHLRTAQELSESIQQISKSEDNVIIKLFADNEKDYFELDLDKILFIEANDNYSAIYYISDKGYKKVLLRSSLKRMADQLQDYDNIIRCHKSYIVNFHNIARVSGNTQGYRLHFNETDIEIPVSRDFPKDLIRKIKSKI